MLMRGLRVFAVLMALLVFVPSAMEAQEGTGWVSPGLRFVYRFGEGGGMSFGAEVTYMKWTEFSAFGAVGSVDLLFGNHEAPPGIRLQVGPQMSWSIVGTSLGYSWQHELGESHMGFFATLYGLVGLMPHFGLEYLNDLDETRFEAGLLVKFPRQVEGEERSWSLGG
jgi:hypothetical protein